MHALEVNTTTVKSVVEKFAGLHALPIHLTMAEMNLTYAQVVQLRSRMNQVFGKYPKIDLQDTIVTITDKLI